MLFNQLDTFIEFHLIKNRNKDSVKKMPIHNWKVWAHDLNMVVIMLEDPRKKQLVGLVYSINQISNEFTPTSIEKGFVVKNMKDKTSHNIIVCWNDFVKVLKIENHKSQKDSQKGSTTHSQSLRGLVAFTQQKDKKRKNRIWEKKKICCSATLALGSWPKQGFERVRAKNEPKSHISCSQECKRVWGNETPHSQMTSHFGNWSPNGLPNIQKAVARVKNYWIKDFLISLERSWNLNL